MDIDKFVNEIKKYYGNGKYENAYVEKMVREYLKKYYPYELRKLWTLLVLNYSRSYKVMPDVATLEGINKKFGVIVYINDVRQIPESDRKKQIEPVENEEDFSGDIGEMWEEMKKSLKSKSNNTDKKEEGEIVK